MKTLDNLEYFQLLYSIKFHGDRLPRPSVIWDDGTVRFDSIQGRSKLFPSRSKGPSMIRPGGIIEFYSDAGFHRLDGPAVVSEDGSKEYWINYKQIQPIEYFSVVGKL